jgi:hypothetical protein
VLQLMVGALATPSLAAPVCLLLRDRRLHPKEIVATTRAQARSPLESSSQETSFWD